MATDRSVSRMKLLRWIDIRFSKRKKNGSLTAKKKRNGDINESINEQEKKTSCNTKSGRTSIHSPNKTSTLMLDDVSSLPQEKPVDNDNIKSTQTPTLSRCRIKTNPWVRSPWLLPRQSYGSTSSTSTDSGCVNESLNSAPENSWKNFGESSSSSRSIYSNQCLDNKPTNYQRECSSSDDFISSASSSIFSSRSSIISSDNDLVWSTATLPSSLSLRLLDAVPPSPSQASTINSIELDSTSSMITASSNHDYHRMYTNQKNFKPLPTNIEKTRRRSEMNKTRFLPLLWSKYQKSHNEKWVSMATDMVSSDSEDESRKENYRNCDGEVPSPAPNDMVTSADKWFYTSDHQHINSCPGSQLLIPTSKDWNFEFNENDANDTNFNNIQLINKIIRITSQIQNSYSEENLELSPQTADSGLGFSGSSSSTSPSFENGALDPSSLNRKGSNEDIDNLSEEIKKLRFEAKNILDNINGERKEDLEMREKRLAFLREIIEYKMLVLIQSLDQLWQRLK